jgi:hypothetical protein
MRSTAPGKVPTSREEYETVPERISEVVDVVDVVAT